VGWRIKIQYIFRGEVKIFAAFGVSEQYTVVLVEICLRQGKALGRENGKMLGSGLRYEQRRKYKPRLCSV
jgi:hypothetical protein